MSKAPQPYSVKTGDSILDQIAIACVDCPHNEANTAALVDRIKEGEAGPALTLLYQWSIFVQSGHRAIDLLQEAFQGNLRDLIPAGQLLVDVGIPALLAEVRRLRNQPVGAIGLYWQVMETAPRDGTPVLGWFPSGIVSGIRWSGWGGGTWQDVQTGHNLLSSEPMYWMSMPPAPQEVIS